MPFCDSWLLYKGLSKWRNLSSELLEVLLSAGILWAGLLEKVAARLKDI